MPGEQRLQIVGAVFAKPPLRQFRNHRHSQGIGARRKRFAARQRKAEPDAIAIEIGMAQIEPHAIGKAHHANAQPRVAPVGYHTARRAKIAIAKAARNRREHGSGGGFARGPGAAQRVGAAIGRAATVKSQQRRIERQRLRFQRIEHQRRGDRRGISVEPRQRVGGRGRHFAIGDCGQRGMDQRGVRSGFGFGGGIFQPFAQIGELFVEFGLREPLRQRLPQHGGGGDQAAAPFAVFAVDDEIGGAADMKHVRRAEPGAAKRWIDPVRQALKATVDDAIADQPQQRAAAVGNRVGLVEPRPVARGGDALAQRGVGADFDPVAPIGLDAARLDPARWRGGLGAPIGKMRRDRAGHRGCRKIADQDQRCAIGPVMGAPECRQRFGIGARNAAFGPDRQATKIRRTGIEKLRHVVPVA